MTVQPPGGNPTSTLPPFRSNAQRYKLVAREKQTETAAVAGVRVAQEAYTRSLPLRRRGASPHPATQSVLPSRYLSRPRDVRLPRDQKSVDRCVDVFEPSYLPSTDLRGTGYNPRTTFIKRRRRHRNPLPTSFPSTALLTQQLLPAMHDPVPPGLVDMIINQVGRGQRQIRRPPLEEDRPSKPAPTTDEALKNCALVARPWTPRSHKNLFHDVVFVIVEKEGIRDLLPSAVSLKLVEFLAIRVAPQSRRRGSITLHLLAAISVCLLESLHIEGGFFPLSRRPGLRTCFNVLSGQLLALTFRFCLFDPELLCDILAIRNTDATITVPLRYPKYSMGAPCADFRDGL